MKIPKKLKIGAHEFIVEEKEIEDKACGYTSFIKARITIDSRLPQTQKESTLIHEILHTLNTTLDDDRLGHSLLDSLAEQLYQVLKENKLLK